MRSCLKRWPRLRVLRKCQQVFIIGDSCSRRFAFLVFPLRIASLKSMRRSLVSAARAMRFLRLRMYYPLTGTDATIICDRGGRPPVSRGSLSQRFRAAGVVYKSQPGPDTSATGLHGTPVISTRHSERSSLCPLGTLSVTRVDRSARLNRALRRSVSARSLAR